MTVPGSFLNRGRELAWESCPQLLALLEEAEAFFSLSFSAVFAAKYHWPLSPDRRYWGHGHGPGHAPGGNGHRWLFRLSRGRGCSSDGCIHHPQPRAHLCLRGGWGDTWSASRTLCRGSRPWTVGKPKRRRQESDLTISSHWRKRLLKVGDMFSCGLHGHRDGTS